MARSSDRAPPGRDPRSRARAWIALGLASAVASPFSARADEPPHLGGPLSPLPPPAEMRGSPARGLLQREIATVFGGAALIGLGIGTAYGLRTASLSSQANALCDGAVCHSAGFWLREDARRDGDISTVAFTVAISLVLEAAVFWLTAPSSGPALPAR